MIDRKPQGNRAQLARFFVALGLPGLARSLNRNAPAQSRSSQELSDRRFLLQVVQPGLAGLMDGSVSTLAPIFAAAFATRHPMTAFLLAMSAATGAGISMAFSEALSADAGLPGQGNPVTPAAILARLALL